MLFDSLLTSALGLASSQQSSNIDASCSHPGLSCSAEPPDNPDTCCLNHPSGHFLLTQFWDASPPLGSAENWTIHGLWPDHCAGGFDQFCDRSREHSNIATILGASSPDLLSFMDQHWLSLNGDNNHLWAHEWNKHGTCISTLEPECYDSSAASAEAVTSYFTHAASLYSTLDTYATLAEAGIAPSRDGTYTLANIQAVLSAAHDGNAVTLRCHGSSLQEIWYHYSVRGPLRHAEPFTSSPSSPELKSNTKIFIPTAPDISKSNCPQTGIRYLPKAAHHAPPPHRPTHTSSHPVPNPTNTPTRPFSGRGHLVVRPISSPPSTSKHNHDTQNQHPLTNPQPHPLSSSPKGCLIRAGLWYTSGSCATYLAQTDPPHFPIIPQSLQEDPDTPSRHTFTLSSLYSPCAITGPTLFTCAKDLGVQTIFEGINATVSDGADDSDQEEEDGKQHLETREVLAWRGRTTFYADKVPGRFEKVEIYADDDGGTRRVAVQVEWEGI